MSFENNNSSIENSIYSEIYLTSHLFDSGDNNRPIYQLSSEIQDVKKIKVSSIVIPFSYYVFTSANNAFQVIETTGTSTVLVAITPGNYSSATFIAEMKSKLEAGSIATGNSLTYTISISDSTNKLTIAATGNFLVSLTNSSKLTGFIAATTSASSATAQNVINLSGTRNVFLRSNLANFLSRDTIIENNNNYNNVLKQIPMNANSGDIVYKEFIDTEFIDTSLNISDITLYITDEDGNLIDFNGSTWTITLQSIAVKSVL